MKRFLNAALLVGCHTTLGVDDLQFNRTEDGVGASGGGNCKHLTSGVVQQGPVDDCSREIEDEERLGDLGMFTLTDGNGEDGISGSSFSSSDGGSLQLTPEDDRYWFEDKRGPFLYYFINGNFALMAYVRSEGESATESPQGLNNGSALLVRETSGNDQYGRWWMWALAVDETSNEFGTQLWQGEDDAITSKASHSPAETNHGCMMMCRVGDKVHLYRNLVNSTGDYEGWTDRGTTDSAVQNQQYQVGIASNKGEGDSDIVSRFYWISLREGISSQDDCLTVFGSGDPTCGMESLP